MNITDNDAEEFHANDGNPYWNESAWFSFQVPERELNGWVYFWHRPNMGASFGGLCLWDASSANAMDCVYFDWDLHPFSAAKGMHDFAWQNSLTAQCIKPLDQYRFTYEDSYCRASLNWKAFMPPHATTFSKKSYGDFGNGHYDQGGRMKGTIKLPFETIEIDCLSLSDRSWGPRQQSSNPRVNYSWAVASETSSFCLGAMGTHPNDNDPVIGTTERICFGHVMKDGVIADVFAGERRVVERGEDGRPLKLTLHCNDELGREFSAKGTCVAWLRFPGLTFIAYWWSMVKWEFDGQVAYGEEQEGWAMQDYRRFRRSTMTNLT